MKVFCSTAARRYSACFDTTDDFRGTVKVDVTLPVTIVIHTTAMQPMTLNPIDHILQVGIVPITLNHDHQLFFTFVLHLNREIADQIWVRATLYLFAIDEDQCAECQLNEKDHCQSETELEKRFESIRKKFVVPVMNRCLRRAINRCFLSAIQHSPRSR